MGAPGSISVLSRAEADHAVTNKPANTKSARAR